MSYCIITTWNILLHLIALFLRLNKKKYVLYKTNVFCLETAEMKDLWKNVQVALLPQQEHLLAVTGGLDLQCVFHTVSCFPLRRRIRSGSGNSTRKKQSRFCAKLCASIIEHYFAALSYGAITICYQWYSQRWKDSKKVHSITAKYFAFDSSDTEQYWSVF